MFESLLETALAESTLPAVARDGIRGDVLWGLGRWLAAAAAAPRPSATSSLRVLVEWDADAAHPSLGDLVDASCGLALAGELIRWIDGRSLKDLAEDDLLSLARGWDKVLGFGHARLREAVGEFGLRRTPSIYLDPPAPITGAARGEAADQETARTGAKAKAPSAPGWLGADDYTGAEVALVLNCSARAGDLLVAEAMDLVTDLPTALQALAKGDVSLAAVKAIVTETAHLTGPQRAAVADRVLPLAGRRTPGQTRAAARRAAIGIDPAAARAREKAAARGRCVRTGRDTDGMGDLSINAPIADIAAAFEHLDAHARAAHAAAGEDRGLEAIRADLAIGALTGHLHLGTPTLGLPTDDQSDGESEAETGKRRRRRLAVRTELVVTGAASTLAGEDDNPGELSGYGPITAQTLRTLAKYAPTVHTLTRDPDTRMVTGVAINHPPGHTGQDTPAFETTAYKPPAALARYVIARDRTCRYPGCTRRAVRCDLDHTIPHPHGPTRACNLGALCRRHHRLKQTPGWALRQPTPGTFIWTTPTGRTYTVEPPDPLNPD